MDISIPPIPPYKPVVRVSLFIHISGISMIDTVERPTSHVLRVTFVMTCRPTSHVVGIVQIASLYRCRIVVEIFVIIQTTTDSTQILLTQDSPSTNNFKDEIKKC